jgi:hypothetical protein
MIHTSISRIRPDKVELLRAWFAEGKHRAEEVRETFRQEGVTHEQVYLIPTADGTVLVYISEMADVGTAMRAFADSELPIDAEHRKVMETAIAGQVDGAELVFELTL